MTNTTAVPHTPEPGRVAQCRLLDKCQDNDARVKLQFARGQLQKGRIVQVYVMDTGRIDAETKGSRAVALLAMFIAGCEDVASAQVVQRAKRPQGKGTGSGGAVRSATLTPLGYIPPEDPAPGQSRKSKPSR